MSKGTPLLSIRRTALSYNDDPVELRRSLVNTAEHEYWADIGAPGLSRDRARRASDRDAVALPARRRLA